MPDTTAQKQIIISSDDARGADSAEEVSKGDTLVPMLITVIVLTVLGVGAVALFVGISMG
ncbi:hypothetical protein [Hyphomonas sp.]|jgi:hypothetical protein|uniref:hypothetical protein n=1 Tax=Hyphomonas sp. TaxID=87 RepID=UPI0030FC36AA